MRIPIKNGFILVTVMSLLLLITLLTLGVLETSLLLRKQANTQWQFWQFSTQASQVNQQIINALQQHQPLPCILPYQSDNRYWEHVATEWSTPTCDDTHNHYRSYSIIELLPDILCVAESEKPLQHFEIYRIDTQTKTEMGSLLRIQSTLILPMSEIKTCTQYTSKVSSGLQAWRIDFWSNT